MLMYATICKSVNNTDRTIYKMIIAVDVINAKATNEGIDNLGFALVKNREDAVYTLVLTILEHFNGEFRWYKDTYLSRVMELPEMVLSTGKQSL
ncbi:hypothetical protein H5410_030717 [Solanum commersonii]|uniref:DUF7746 domain-containing protein n=1 Tax=Solanum commersonii TaxID=4109 RepID=A0A9J5YF31_SOLCO|nr:hypothetical protein H5410_030717 [Solanum commersonii]